MPDYDVTVSAVFSKPAGGDVTIGSVRVEGDFTLNVPGSVLDGNSDADDAAAAAQAAQDAANQEAASKAAEEAAKAKTGDCTGDSEA